MKLQIEIKKLFVKIILSDMYQNERFKQEIMSVCELVQNENLYKISQEESLYEIFQNTRLHESLKKTD